MSFQGPGDGISGYSAQFTVGYANSAGNINGYAPNAGYAGYAGSAGNINGYAPSAGYANQASNVNLTSASQGQFGWQGQNTTPSWLWGSNQGNVETVFAPGNLSVGYAGYAGSAGNINGYAPVAGNINGYAPSAGYANQATYAANLGVQGIGGSTWAWAGQPGIPNHYWGSNQGGYHAVWQANQGYVGYAGSAGNINGYAPVAGTTNNSGGYVRFGRNGAYGGMWGQGLYAYNQQGTYAFSDLYVQYGNYYSFYGFYWGNWNPTAGQFQGNARLGMFGVNASVNYVVLG